MNVNIKECNMLNKCLSLNEDKNTTNVIQDKLIKSHNLLENQIEEDSKKSRNSSCGRCSCSSGSRSEHNNDKPIITQSKTLTNKKSYFKDGFQKLKNKLTDKRKLNFTKSKLLNKFSTNKIIPITWNESESDLSTSSKSSPQSKSLSSSNEETSLSSLSSTNSYSDFDDLQSNWTNFNKTRSDDKTIHDNDKINSAVLVKPNLSKISTLPTDHSLKHIWLNSLRWVIQSKITWISSHQLLNLMENKRKTKALAEYPFINKICLVKFGFLFLI